MPRKPDIAMRLAITNEDVLKRMRRIGRLLAELREDLPWRERELKRAMDDLVEAADSLQLVKDDRDARDRDP